MSHYPHGPKEMYTSSSACTERHWRVPMCLLTSINGLTLSLGEEALKAMNVFHHLSYEGAVDIDQITDPVLRQAVIGIINNFGQTPRQVFKKPHPSRKSTLAVSSPQTANAGEPTSAMPRTLVYFPEQLKRSIVATVKVGRTGAGAITCNGGVGDIIVSDKGVVALGQQQLAVYKGTNRYLSWEYGDNSLRLMRIDNGKTMGACENMHVGCLSAVTFADEQVLITGGEDSCVSVWQFADQKTVNGSRTGVDVAPKILQILHGHTKRITAIAASRPYSIIVSGSGDKTCIVWDLNQMDYIRQLRGHPDTITAIAINNQTGNIVTCSRSQIRLWTVNGTCLAIKYVVVFGIFLCNCGH
ncbi:hypothetical protein SARC_00860 [Sphaeroforma arctica JP610]|uniref:BEACH domain-containing protein n=1 Tax=Sphaeroforma arctica JP610 TaxID=667725 RepID=A0A0L0GDB8_9EUKA|nr:hypothetical protein SARC_00860 [Sphaeroforma arctica JP610]KNC87007.1 hypothetical protein SARC_00860 [Sphaeroforma arctica JP610]|eukprot:XP_014160909.1 hypothetical protein SARC_00860 [Sphaeroforma arctica JP610]